MLLHTDSYYVCTLKTDLKNGGIMQLQHAVLTIILFLGYLSLWYIKRRELLKSDGIEVNVLSKATKPIQRYFHALEKVMTLLIVILIVFHGIFSDNWTVFRNFQILNKPTIMYVGFILGIIGLVLCRIAQVTIGKSWRVGIDEQSKSALVTNGIYKYIRNPTYTGLYFLCAGVWLINPTVVYSYWILLFYVMMEFQVRCEEEYLETMYGNEYLNYCKRTKRYIPIIY